MTRRISVDEYKRLAKAPGKAKLVGAPKHKYGNVKIEADGFTFDSKAEARYYAELRLREKAGAVKLIVVHPGYDLGSCYYKADFRFAEWRNGADGCPEFGNWYAVVVDVKGSMTRDCAIKLKLMREKYGIDVMLLTKETHPRLFR